MRGTCFRLQHAAIVSLLLGLGAFTLLQDQCGAEVQSAASRAIDQPSDGCRGATDVGRCGSVCSQRPLPLGHRALQARASQPRGRLLGIAACMVGAERLPALSMPSCDARRGQPVAAPATLVRMSVRLNV
jgi:hypothetical protein